MKQTKNKKNEKGGGLTRKQRRALELRRIIAAVLVGLAVILAALSWKALPSMNALLWGVATLLMLIEALLLTRRRGLGVAVYAAVGGLCLALIVAGPFTRNLVQADGAFVPREVLATQLRITDDYPKNFDRMDRLEALDMRASTVTDFAPVAERRSLRLVDVRENYAFDQAAHDALASALPECRIRWSVPVADTWFDSDASDVDLTGLPLSAAQLRALFDSYPDKRFTYEVPLFGGRYAPDVESLSLRDQAVDAGAIDEALTLLPAVREVDLRGEPAAAETIAALSDAHPDIHFLFSCDVPGVAMTTEDASVQLTGGSYQDLLTYMDFIDYMPNLERIDARAVQLTNEQALALHEDARSEKVQYYVTVFGVKVSTYDTELNLDDVKVPSVDAVEQVLAMLPNLKRVSMCGSGLSTDQMGQLFDAHPDIKFVWWLKIARYKVRTDATMFTTDLWDGNDFNYTSQTFANLRYCTDLMMLDLGHCRIRNIDGIAGLKKLRVLILADNKISNISALEGLEDLEYVELFLNNIRDFSPLANKTKLLDLNVYYNPISDITPILTCTSLERFWAGGTKLSTEDLMKLKETIPNVQINIKGRSSTGEGWRKHKRYDILSQMYDANEYIPFE